jgi:hypothetical protein
MFRPTRIPLLLTLLSLTGCERCQTEVLNQEPPQLEQTDTFEQKQAAQVDILWVIDNSESMLAEQAKVAERFNQFFNQLITSQVDYHIGVVTTDPAEGGVLRSYEGPTVSGCTGCRFITNDVSCDDPTVDVSGLTSESEIENRLLEDCEAQLVFRKLISVGSDGSSSEQAFEQAAEALGVRDVDAATGLPMNNPPAENADFIRQSASLYIVFVSDEEEGDKRDGSPIRYYERLFESLKGAGNENKVSVAAITGYPADDALPPIGDVCPVLSTTFDTNVGNDDPRSDVVRQAFLNYELGCLDEEAGPTDNFAGAETGGRFIELACRTGGVVANMCEANYTTALNALGADAAGLLRKFVISKAAEMWRGPDCQLFTEDDQLIDCDDNGSTNDDIDGPICVKARCLGADEARLIERDDVSGWRYEQSTSSVRFDGGCLPAPDSDVEIRYLLTKKGDKQCG